MNSKYIIASVLILFSSFTYSCSNFSSPNLDNSKISSALKLDFLDMVTVDKNYVSSLVLTSQGNIDKSKKAISMLKDSWRLLKDKNYSSLNQKDKNLFDSIDKVILDAEKYLAESKISESHEVLEMFRTLSYEFRKNNNIDYYMDYLTDFHTEMEKVLNAGISEGDLDKKFNLVKETLPKAIESFNFLENKTFDKKIFSFSDEKDLQRINFIKAEKQKLEELKKLVDSNDKELTLTKSQEIKENFVKLFSLFGNMDSIK